MTPVNIFVMRNLPNQIRSVMRNPSRPWHVHVDNDLDKSFVCLKVVNVHYGFVWLVMSTFEFPAKICETNTFHGEPFDLTFLGETEKPKYVIWKSIAAMSRKWEHNIQSPYRQFQATFFEMTENEYSHNEAVYILNEAYNKSFSDFGNKIQSWMGPDMEEMEDFDITVYPLKTEAEIKDLHYLSGYEREMRFHIENAWTYIMDAGIGHMHKKVLIAYLTKEGKDKYQDEPIPVGYVAALDGDDNNHNLAIPQNCLSVISFAVQPRIRRKKVASLLFQRLLLEAKKPVQVKIDFDNFEAALFLRSLNFRAPEISDDSNYLIFNESNPERLVV